MSRPPNDALHAQVSKGHHPEQVLIDRIDRGVGKTRLGECVVQEMTAQSALNDFTMGDRVTGVAWSVNPYVGCQHQCTYCFVPNTLHVERRRWGRYVIVKHNLAALLRKELEEKSRMTVYVSTATDPYQPIEAERRLTRSCLQVLARRQWPVDVLTRSPLVLRDVDVLKRFRQLRVGLSVPTLDESARRVIEPHAPPVAARLDALRRLGEAGLPTYANYSPAYPPSNGLTAGDIARTFKDARVGWVNTSVWRYQQGYLAGLWDRVHKDAWADLARFVADPERQRRFRAELDDAFRSERLRLRTGFFNEPMHDAPPAARHGPLEPMADPATVGLDRPCS